MKKVGYLLFVLLLFLTINVNASSNCDLKELARLKEIAKKVEFDYNYKLVNDKAVFSINAVNLNSEVRVLIIDDYYQDKYKEFKSNSNHTATLDNFEDGSKVSITMKAFVPNWCSGEILLTKIVKIPYYNYYYDETKCSGHEDFKYCKLLVDKKISQEEFDKQFETYLKNKDKNEKPIDNEKSDNTTLYLIIAGVVLIIVLTTFVVMSVIKRRKKNSL